MKLLGNGTIYLGNFGVVKDSMGDIVPSAKLYYEPAETSIAITRLSADTFSIDLPTAENAFKLGERVNMVQSDFDVKCVIIQVGHNRYKVQHLFDDIGYDYDEVEDVIIPEGTVIAYRLLELIRPISMEAGKYYTQYGDMLIIGDMFTHLGAINVDDIYSLKPELRGKGISDWELSNMLRVAYDFVMKDLSGYEFDIDDRFKYINIGGMTQLILYKTISIYEASAGDGVPIFTYSNKYRSALNGFTPYLKIDNDGAIEGVKKKGITW